MKRLFLALDLSAFRADRVTFYESRAAASGPAYVRLGEILMTGPRPIP